ncbi:hypothetical protein [Streptomyces sp. NPDC021356]|uniref:hypothetical protein n=1 Tax=Streptomyces sp. NPDC021356 TaxID=3154900 RepID=UPI0033F9ABA4
MVGRWVVGVVSGSERTPRITTLPGPSGSTDTRVYRQASARNRADFWYSSSPTCGSVRARTITPNWSGLTLIFGVSTRGAGGGLSFCAVICASRLGVLSVTVSPAIRASRTQPQRIRTACRMLARVPRSART